MFQFNQNSFIGLLLVARSLSPSTAIAEERNAATPTQPDHILTDGTAVEIPESGVKIIPAAGWEMIKGRPNISLILQKPLVKELAAADKGSLAKNNKAGTVKITYQPNIVLATMHQALPIDGKTAAEIADEITKRFKDISGVGNFQIQQEPKIFEYRTGADALIVYSTYTMNDVALGQMHMFFSGKDKSFLMTYTDQADHFMSEGADKNQDYQDAFRTMLSFEVNGKSPMRYREEIQLGIGIAVPVLFLLFVLVWARRHSSSFYRNFSASSCYDSDEAMSSKRDFEDYSVEPSDELTALSLENELISSEGIKDEDIWNLQITHSSHNEEEPVWDLAPRKQAHAGLR